MPALWSIAGAQGAACEACEGAAAADSVVVGACAVEHVDTPVAQGQVAAPPG
jgi:hypothetical protein